MTKPETHQLTQTVPACRAFETRIARLRSLVNTAAARPSVKKDVSKGGDWPKGSKERTGGVVGAVDDLGLVLEGVDGDDGLLRASISKGSSEINEESRYERRRSEEKGWKRIH